MNAKHLDNDGANRDAIAELFYEAGIEPARAERIAAQLWEMSEPGFGEDED